MVDRKWDFYNVSSTGGSEINLRKEFQHTQDGNAPEIAKFQPALLRRFRLDGNGTKILCSCVSPVTGEPDRERRCPICLGEKYQWDEIAIELYHAEVNTESQKSDRESLRRPGIMNTPLRVFYISYLVDLTQEDKLVLLVLDKEGNISQPQRRSELYVISTLNPMRLDNGKLEFWKVNGYRDNNKHL